MEEINESQNGILQRNSKTVLYSYDAKLRDLFLSSLNITSDRYNYTRKTHKDHNEDQDL